MFLKTTSRYKLNKFISELPVDKISFAADVSAPDKAKLIQELHQLMRNNSITVIVLEHHTPKNIL